MDSAVAVKVQHVDVFDAQQFENLFYNRWWVQLEVSWREHVFEFAIRPDDKPIVIFICYCFQGVEIVLFLLQVFVLNLFCHCDRPPAVVSIY